MNPRSLKMETDFGRKPWSERFVLFVIVFVFWMILVWPVSEEGGLLMTDVVIGMFMSALVALVMRAMIRRNMIRMLKPRSWFWMIIYIPVFFWYVAKGSMDVVYRVLHPSMPIHPGIVRMKSRLETDTGRIVLANSITLTPGTLTVDVTEDGVFYVHWLNVLTDDEEEAAEHTLRHFEWFIKRIFE